MYANDQRPDFTSLYEILYPVCGLATRLFPMQSHLEEGEGEKETRGGKWPQSVSRFGEFSKWGHLPISKVFCYSPLILVLLLQWHQKSVWEIFFLQFSQLIIT